MTKKELYARFVDYFRRAMPDAQTELHFRSNYELLVSVMLSAQCTDRRVNMVTPSLFDRFPTVDALAAADVADVYERIRSISYPNSKARHLVGMAQQVVERFGGDIPSELDALMSLPGVGRKTANVVMSVGFGQARMAVDTHVFRVSHRIGLVPQRCTTPLSTERELVKHLPPDTIHDAHHWLILHGRYVCKAIHPLCEQCGIKDFCRKAKECL